jgi:hypothetical protein
VIASIVLVGRRFEIRARVPAAERHHEPRDHDRRWRAHDRSRHELPRRVVDHVAQDRHIEQQHGARDRRHARAHDHVELAARERAHIRTNEQRCLDHADEDVRGRRQCHRATEAERALEHEREAAHHERKDAPIREQRGQRAHDEHERKRAKPEHEAARAGQRLERKGCAAQVAEHEARAGLGRRLQREHRVVQQAKQRAHRCQLQERPRDDEL